jgi:hypothetical protein
VSALNVLNATPKYSTYTMFVMFTDELFLGFEAKCNTLTGLCNGQEEVGYSALLILVECCTINFCASGIAQKVISLQLKGYSLRKRQFHVAQILLHSHSHNLLILH